MVGSLKRIVSHCRLYSTRDDLSLEFADTCKSGYGNINMISVFTALVLNELVPCLNLFCTSPVNGLSRFIIVSIIQPHERHETANGKGLKQGCLTSSRGPSEHMTKPSEKSNKYMINRALHQAAWIARQDRCERVST